MKFSTDIQGPQRIRSNDSDDLLTFPVLPPAGQNVLLFSVISHHLLKGFAQNVVQTYMVPR